ncbi:MAG: Gfo/Idh/MocA family oxidoreductase [Ktedonobacteraceae bacterium]
MKRVTKIALVGCGRHMQTTLVPYLRRLEGYEVEACVDINEEAAQLVQQLSHAKQWATDLEDVDLNNVDAALVALPPQAAYRSTSHLVQQRIACFVEKPPASTSHEIQELMQLASALEVRVQVGFNFRFADAMVALHTCAADHKNDQSVTHVEFRSKHPSGSEWERDDPVEAWLYHNGIHALDLLRWMAGEVQQVHASIIYTQDSKFIIVVLVEHVNKSISTLKLGTLTDKFELRAELLTPDGYQFSLPNLGEVLMPLRAGKMSGEVIYRAGNLDNGWRRAGYGPELQDFLDHYQHYSSSSPSLLDALKASQFCDAIMRSLQKGTVSQFSSESFLSPVIYQEAS